MPQVGKQALSQFIRTKCMRQLALNLYPDNAAFEADRNRLGMPYPQDPRPGLRQIQETGHEWQAEKLHDLTQTFGGASVVGNSYRNRAGQLRYRPIDLNQHLSGARAPSFIVESEFTIDAGGAFETALGISGHRGQHNLDYQGLRPDVIEVAAPGTFGLEVAPDGSTRSLSAGHQRLQLRVIDIKLTAHPSPGYFAEVALYSMAVAGWLVDHSLDQDFVVVPNGAVWPGSHQASNLYRVYHEAQRRGTQATIQQLKQAMEQDLEPVPFRGLRADGSQIPPD